MSSYLQSAWLHNNEYKKLNELSEYYGVSRSDICGAALSMVFENNELLVTSDNNYKFDVDSFKKVCSESAFDIFKYFLEAGKTKTAIHIEKGTHTIVIPKGCAMKFVPPFIISLEVSVKLEINIDVEPWMLVDIYNEINNSIVEDISLSDISKYIVRIHL